jgi:hypothetical protein
MNIYSGAEMLKRMDPQWREMQRKELIVIGTKRAQEYGASGLTVDFVVGYELGLATARAIIRGGAEVKLKGCEPEKIL